MNVVRCFLRLRLVRTRRPINLMGTIFTRREKLFRYQRTLVMNVSKGVTQVMSAPRHESLVRNQQGVRGVLIHLNNDTCCRLYTLSYEDRAEDITIFLTFFQAFGSSLLSMTREHVCALVIFLQNGRFRILLLQCLSVSTRAINVGPYLVRRFTTNAKGTLRVSVSIRAVSDTRILNGTRRTFRHMVKVARRPATRRGPFSVITTVRLRNGICGLNRQRHNAQRIITTTISTMNTIMSTVVNGRRFRRKSAATILNGAVTSTPTARDIPRRTYLTKTRHAAKKTESIVLYQLYRCLRFVRGIFVRGAYIGDDGGAFRGRGEPPMITIFHDVGCTFFLAS